MIQGNLTMLTDLYQLTMMQGYFKNNLGSRTAVFDMFYRENPCDSGYVVYAGLEQAVKYIESLSFKDEDIAYLRSLSLFDEDFLKYLKDIRFTGDIYSVPEGSIVFPEEPILRVKAPLIQAQLIETTVLNIINHQSLIATKASRVCHAAEGQPVMEFGLRRAQGPDAGVYGARAAIIGGCSSTSNVLAGKLFDVAVSGTHAHSWIMSFDSEYEAFKTYADAFPDSFTLLVDTYDTLKSGMPNAIRVFEEKRREGKLPKQYGIRLDSGDLAYVSKKARIMLDEAGFKDAKITASSDLDEDLIFSLKSQNAKIDAWGVGTRLITSKTWASLGGVYKLSAIEDTEHSMRPKLKISENPNKITNPGIKKIIRLYDISTGMMKADLITLEHEKIDTTKDLTIFDPKAIWRTTTLKANEFSYRELLEPVILDGKTVYSFKSVAEIRSYCSQELNTLWEEFKRITQPHIYIVDLSQELYELKNEIIRSCKNAKSEL